MALPDLIEIVPLTAPVHAEITVPGSKSITNRALILAALADGETILRGALWSEDTQIMVECLQELGFMVNVEADPTETCNRTITVYGNGGAVPRGGTEAQPLDLFVGNAGTAARFLAPFLCLGSGVYRLHGVARMHERPQAALFSALRELSYRVESEKGNDKLPVKIFGEGAKKAKCRVSIEESSQFASALLLSAKHGGWEIEIVGENAEESPYVAMTTKLIEAFPKGGEFQIEPDASSGSYFWGAGWLFPAPQNATEIKVEDVSRFDLALYITGKTNELKSYSITVKHWPTSGWQIDQYFPIHLQPPKFPKAISRAKDLGDSIMTAIILAPFSSHTTYFTELGRLRLQECERVKALEKELRSCGGYAQDWQSAPQIDLENLEEYFAEEDAEIVLEERLDTLEIRPAELHGAEIETYNDHRMAMCFAVLGLKVPGIKIKNPACVKKTFPNFFQKLAAQPPHGLGATILDGKTGRKLTHEELFAD